MASVGRQVSSQDKPVLNPLSLKDSGAVESGSTRDREDQCCPCLFCDFEVDLTRDKSTILRHLILTHRLVIADVKLIADFKQYALYWKKKFFDHPCTEFCSVIKINSKPTDIGPEEDYYLLSDVLPEDKVLRECLQKEKLERILVCQQEEREETHFSRSCLFCKLSFTGNRAELFNHMAFDHGFNVGQPDNLVFTSELLDKLKEKLDNLQCLYCEKEFRDRTTLKEHMRKKQHKKINSKNRDYDKYYIINYLELGKNWETIQSEDDTALDDDTGANEDELWNDWCEESGAQAVCLFCEFSSADAEQLISHIKDVHYLDLLALRKEMNLTFYQQVKLINFIRRQIYQLRCMGCQQTFDCRKELLDHMETSLHTKQVPEISIWDQPQYYFPTYENDNLLCQLEEDEKPNLEESQSISIPVIPEETGLPEKQLLPQCIHEEILS